MDLVSIVFAIGLAFLVGAFIARPLIEQSQARVQHSAPADDLIAERESVLTALRELDFDHLTGKIADEDYTAQRAALVTRGVALLQELDEIAQTPTPSADERLEAEVRAARARLLGTQPAPHTCPTCGTLRRAHDRFCSKCGAALSGLPAEVA